MGMTTKAVGLSASSAPKTAAAQPTPFPYEHSLLHSNPRYTLVSIAFFLAFFIQPHSWRVALWRWMRGTIEDERLFILAFSIGVHALVAIGANAMMGLIYYAELPFFEQFKIQKDKPWPWKRGTEERRQYFALIRKSIALIAFNHYILTPLLIWFSYEDARKRGMRADLGSVPHWYTSLWQIAVAMVVEDTLFYWAHRTLHHPAIYAHVHKVHHQYKTSIGIASEYAHPIEFLFSNVLPFMAGPNLVGMHYFTLFMWTFLRIGETVDGHSGYEFPWSPYRLLPFSGSSTAHDYHHSHNVGNYGSFFTWWDRAMGTDRAFLRYEEKLRATQEVTPVPASPAVTTETQAAPSRIAKTSDEALHTAVAHRTRSRSSSNKALKN